MELFGLSVVPNVEPESVAEVLVCFVINLSIEVDLGPFDFGTWDFMEVLFVALHFVLVAVDPAVFDPHLGHVIRILGLVVGRGVGLFDLHKRHRLDRRERVAVPELSGSLVWVALEGPHDIVLLGSMEW